MKTAELTGALLGYWVGVSDGLLVEIRNGTCIREVANGKHAFNPSEDWSQGGPIIERERIAVVRFEHEWCAYLSSPGKAGAGGWYGDFSIDVSDGDANGVGETALIAAMRAYVASKYGDEVPDQ